MHLPKGAFARTDENPDAVFYQQPRLVYHLDDMARAEVTSLYREFLPAGGRILDVMSSWVSHLPPNVTYSRVDGLGMNAVELAANPRLDDYVVHDLNREPRLPYDTQSFDAATLCVSVDYLVQPVQVLRDLARVLTPRAPLLITFSNRCFPTKAISIWHALDHQGRLELVMEFLQQAGGWERITPFASDPQRPGDPLFAVLAYTLAADTTLA